MKHLRFRLLILICWTVFLFSANRLIDPINVSDIAYVFLLTIIVTILFASRIVKVPLWLMLTVPIALFLVLKTLMGSLIKGTSITTTAFEVCAVIMTVILAYWINVAIVDFESAITKIVIGHSYKIGWPSNFGQGYIYSEVRRARNHKRPLALMTVSVDERSIDLSINRMIQQMQHTIMKQYTLSGVSKLLCDHLEDCAIIVQNNDHFLIALPETMPEEVPFIVERLRKQVTEQVGVDLFIGTAVLSIDSYTFEGLVDKATNEMKEDLALRSVSDVQRLSKEKPITAINK